MKLSFFKKFTAGRVLVAIYLLVCIAVGYNIYPIVELTNQSIKRYKEISDESTRKLELMNQLRKNFNTIQSAQFRHVLAYSEMMMGEEEKKLYKALRANDAIFSEYKKLVKTKEEQAYLDTVLSLRKINAATRAELIKISASNQRQKAFDYYISVQEISRLNYSNAVEELTEFIVRQTHSKITATENYIKDERVAINTVLGVSVILILIVGFLIFSVNKKLNLQYTEEKLKEYKHFFTNNNDFVCIANVQGYFEIINPNFEKRLGYSEKELFESKFLSFIHPDDIGPTLREMEKLKTGALTTNFVNRYRKKDGSYLWFDWNTTPDPVTGKLYAIARDITDRKKAEDELKENNFFLNALLENIPDMIFVKDAEELRFVRFNLAGEKLLGYKRNDLIGKNDYDFFPKEQADFFVSKDREVIKNGILLDIKEEKITTANGERWLHTKKIPVTGKNGLPSYLLGISDDITDRKKTEETLARLNKELEQRTQEKLKATTTQLEKVLNIFDNSFWGSDIVNNRMIYVSPGNEKVFGYPEKDFMSHGNLWYQVVVEEDKHKFNDAWTFLNNGSSVSIEFRINHPGKGIRWLESKIAPTLDETGKLIRVDGIAIDITERKNSEEELRENNIELKKINSELDRFVYSTSHDLRAPLLSLEGLLNLSMDHIDSKQELQQYHGIMRKIITDMDETIKDILDYSRNARTEIIPEQLDIKAMVENAVSHFSHTTDRKEIKFSLSINNSTPFFSDRLRVNTIINNLISNAYKYSRQDEQNPFVKFSFTSDKHEGVIKVEDNGEGIPPEYIDKIFEMFLRASEKSEGSGLGLYICHEILNRLKGTIKVNSIPFQGSTFIVRIPNMQ
ncbi:MAG: PAS domain S-box protein [Bacteroidia bacterium]